MSLVVQAIERSLDNYSKYEEKMEHLMHFGDPIMGKKPEQARRAAGPWGNIFSSLSKREIDIEYFREPGA